MTPEVTVIGLDGLHPLPEAAREALAGASLVAGAARHLQAAGLGTGPDPSAAAGGAGTSGAAAAGGAGTSGSGGAGPAGDGTPERVVLGPLEPALQRIRAVVTAGGPVVVLAS
ncbi:MAG TPA: hypothetical protein VFP72_11165, partial [Kineosporiaceae bacterium]|nr:hypothetical protein [Kineosporiaceae bacterium]